jgi:hypothetical protein
MTDTTKPKDLDDSILAQVAGLSFFGGIILGIVIGLLLGGPRVVTQEPGVTGLDLQLAVNRCTPLRATFEQELACFNAIYGAR